MTTNAVPIINLPFLYINSGIPANNATTPNTKLDVSAVQCRDSSNVYDMVIAANTINFGATGLNGLDTGAIDASKMYYIFAISDPVSGNVGGFMASLSATPLMPAGYSAYRIVGYWASDASSHLLAGYVAGNNNDRMFMYDAPQATAITAGNATSYTAVDLSNLVPVLDNMPVYMGYSFTPGAASRTLKLQPAGATGDAVTITGQVTSVVVSNNVLMLAKLASAAPKIAYKVANSGDAAALNVAGFQYFI